MIRISFTWLLLVLAASPFTVPFATCDLGALLAAKSPAQIAPVVPSVQAVAAASERDATSLAPIAGRLEVAKDSTVVTIDLAIPSCECSHRVNRSPQDERPPQLILSARSTVLRL
jgi:hypothetical protein